jgi:hypothetical protein
MNIIQTIRDKISIWRKESLPKQGKEDRWIKSISRPMEGGGQYLNMSNSKYPMRGVPRDSALIGIIGPFKRAATNLIRNMVLAVVAHEIREDRLSEPVRELARGFDLLSSAEGNLQYKLMWQDYKRAFCNFFEEDDAYRFRLQWLLTRLDMKKIRLNANDLYYFRAKRFNVDLKEVTPNLKEELAELRRKGVKSRGEPGWSADIDIDRAEAEKMNKKNGVT